MTQFIAFSNKSDLELNNLKELYLPCPRSNRRSVYFHNDKGKLYEIQKVTVGRKSSWLLNSYIYKDGAVRFISPLDPLFMALPILQHAYTKDPKFKTLDDIFSRDNVVLEIVNKDEEDEEELKDAEYAKDIDVHRLTTIPGFVDQLAHLCDVKEIASDLAVYKLNKDLVLNWLKKKVDQLIANKVFLNAIDETDEKAIQLEAVYSISNYLNQEWFNHLVEKLEISLPKEVVPEPIFINTAETMDTSPAAFFKRVHSEERVVDEQIKKQKTVVPRSLSKVNTRGMKPLTSFFTKK